jgi:transposase
VLSHGHIVVMDNCNTHHEHRGALTQMLNAFGIALLYLPTYSPELSPIEFCFNKVKFLIRSYGQKRTVQLAYHSTNLALSGVSHQDMLGFYRTCGYIV